MASFFDGYLRAALFSSTDDQGEPLDQRFDETQINSETRDHMRDDCERFQETNRALLDECPALDAYRAGCCFWWNRNGHGTGFWDEILVPGALRERLSKAAHAFGEFDLYVGDDGQLYGQ